MVYFTVWFHVSNECRGLPQIYYPVFKNWQFKNTGIGGQGTCSFFSTNRNTFLTIYSSQYIDVIERFQVFVSSIVYDSEEILLEIQEILHMFVWWQAQIACFSQRSVKFWYFTELLINMIAFSKLIRQRTISWWEKSLLFTEN